MNLFDAARKRLGNGQLLLNYPGHCISPTFYTMLDGPGKLRVMCFLPTVGLACRDFSITMDRVDYQAFLKKYEDDPEAALAFFFKYEGPAEAPKLVPKAPTLPKPMITLADLGLLPGGKK